MALALLGLFGGGAGPGYCGQRRGAHDHPRALPVSRRPSRPPPGRMPRRGGAGDPAAEQEKSGDAGLSLSPFAASAPEDSPAQAPSAKDAAPTGTPLTEDGAADALLDWLGQPDARLEPLGLSEDGTAWRFQLDDESVCAVPLDGSSIYRETP